MRAALPPRGDHRKQAEPKEAVSGKEVCVGVLPSLLFFLKPMSHPPPPAAVGAALGGAAVPVAPVWEVGRDPSRQGRLVSGYG